MKRILFSLLVTIQGLVAIGQVNSCWQAVSGIPQDRIQEIVVEGESKKLAFYTLNDGVFRQGLLSATARKASVVAIPNSQGKMEQFALEEASNFAPELQAKYPEIRAFSGRGISDPKAYLCLSVAPSGIQTMVLRGNQQSEFIEPSPENPSLYAFSVSNKRKKGELALHCKTQEVALSKDLTKKALDSKANNGVFKTLRLALSCTGEYAKFFNSTVSGALAAMNATMTRVNGIYNMDLALRLVLVGNNDVLVFTDAATDPYSDAEAGMSPLAGCTGTDCPGTWNSEVQKTISTLIGEENYDIGHLFGGSGGGGDAGCIGCVCDALQNTRSTPVYTRGKGSAYTSPAGNRPAGDFFDIDFVAHEMGHQLGANHTFSYENEGVELGVEPGSGSTIMGYAGITDYDVQSHSDAYFAYRSIKQIQDNLSTKSCPVTVAIANLAPVVSAGADYVIPKSTAFVLKGSASDPEGAALSYCWEQNDPASSIESGANSLAYATKARGPLFRSFSPVQAPNRYFPAYNKVLGGQLVSSWEAVPSVGRSMNFVLTVRDHAALGMAQTNSDAVLITVDGNRGPFAVTSQNVADLSWPLGMPQTVSWSVNGTNTLSSEVNIKMSTDGGLTFPIILMSNTPNDGNEVVYAPMQAAKNCRILIEPTANIYYAVNSKPFALGYSVSSSCNSYVFSGSFPAAIPESVTYAVKTITVPSTTTEVSDVNVSVSFEHSYVSDVQMELVSPSGTVVKLFDKSCGSASSSYELIFDDSGTSLSCGSTTVQTVLAAETLAAFNGENPGGTWQLRYRDDGVNDVGRLKAASVSICTSTYTTLSAKDFEITDFVVYPNPNKGSFAVLFSSSGNSEIEVQVHDLSGRKIYDKFFKGTHYFNQGIQLKGVQRGIYFVTVVDGARKGISKLIIE